LSISSHYKLIVHGLRIFRYYAVSGKKYIPLRGGDLEALAAQSGRSPPLSRFTAPARRLVVRPDSSGCCRQSVVSGTGVTVAQYIKAGMALPSKIAKPSKVTRYIRNSRTDIASPFWLLIFRLL
jgi:hypothetical protein